ncbi:Zinc finger, CCCH-type [Sesbania bispinosa]|nr:Zinc finger, CCCH-type [Sesbania bispinosa]
MEEKLWNASRKEKRKATKKMKRKQRRKEMAEKERQEEEARLNDPEEQRRIQLMEQQEAERILRDRMEVKEINPIQNQEQDGSDNRPTSNPFPPESLSLTLTPANSTTQLVLENVAQQLPNFGTEQDKAHCPFHLKTGACRFGQRCSRVHFYPDKSCTLLMKNMYNGPGLAWEQDEGLEEGKFSSPSYEEVECCFEEFYEDVHTEFLKFGEIVNFKVCKNGSFHLRGNVYVQYKSLDSALLAYNSVNGRYFAGKQVSCKFVNLTRWKVAICGEYMKSGFKTCSHGTACNFIHCFRNPGGDYEWADSDKPPPKYWVKKMAALFGYSDDYEALRERENLSMLKNSINMSKTDSDRYHSRRSRSREIDQLNSGHPGRRKQEDQRKQRTRDEEWNANLKDNHKRKCRDRTPDADSDREWLEEEQDREKHHEDTRKSSFNRTKDNDGRSHEEDSDVDWATITRDNEMQQSREGRNTQKWNRDRDRKRHRIKQRESSRHQSRDSSHVTGDSESDEGGGEMETRHGYSRKSLRHRRSGLQDYCDDYENENDKVDGGWSWRENGRRAHDHRKRLKHQRKLDSINGDTKNVSQESSGEWSEWGLEVEDLALLLGILNSLNCLRNADLRRRYWTLILLPIELDRQDWSPKQSLAVDLDKPLLKVARMSHSCVQLQAMEMKVKVELMDGWSKSSNGDRVVEENAGARGSSSSFSFWTTT